MAVGLGVGLGVGIPFLLLLGGLAGYLLFRRMQTHGERSKSPEPKELTGSATGARGRQELDDAYAIYEAPEAKRDGTSHELP